MDTDEDVSTLEDEDDSVFTQFQFSPLERDDSASEETSSPLSRPYESQGHSSKVNFKVACAYTHVSNSSKYVVYSIMVENGENLRPALVEKRYTDFFKLLSRLQESYPSLMKNLPFPKKVLIGNYTTNLIKQRSRQFEKFLSYIYSKDVLRCSGDFANFMHRREIQESSQLLLHSEFEQAIPILENIYCLLCCLDSDKNILLKVHLDLIVCLHAVSRFEPAHEYALEALCRFKSRNTEGNHLAKAMYLPFLVFCRRLWWVLGKERSVIEIALRKETDKIDSVADLLEVLRDEISLPSLYS